MTMTYGRYYLLLCIRYLYKYSHMFFITNNVFRIPVSNIYIYKKCKYLNLYLLIYFFIYFKINKYFVTELFWRFSKNDVVT